MQSGKRPSHLQHYLINPITSYFFPAPEEKRGRDRKTFAGNMTASLSLQALPSKKKTAADMPGSTSMMTTAFQALSFVSNSAVAIVNTVSATISPTALATAPVLAPPATKPKASAPRESKAAKPAKIKLTDTLTLQIQKLQEAINPAVEIQKDANASRQELLDAQEVIDKNALAQVKLVEALIREHAARRVDLFFYLMVAVYNKKAFIKKDTTVKQYGSGSKISGTNACHSSLFPNIEFIPETGWSLFASKLSLKDTHFENSLNTTVELPRIVNKFDCELEGKFVLAAKKFYSSIYSQHALAILNKVSKGELDPQEGMDEFLNNLKDFFNKIERDYFMPKSRIPDDVEVGDFFKYSAAFKRVWELQKEGSFAACKEDTLKTSIKDEYIYLMLRLSPSDQVKAKYIPGYLKSCYSFIQNEIFTKPEEAKVSMPSPKP